MEWWSWFLRVSLFNNRLFASAIGVNLSLLLCCINCDNFFDAEIQSAGLIFNVAHVRKHMLVTKLTLISPQQVELRATVK